MYYPEQNYLVINKYSIMTAPKFTLEKSNSSMLGGQDFLFVLTPFPIFIPGTVFNIVQLFPQHL